MPSIAFSPQELAFLDAIHENPRDDVVRLIYADWLDEHGGQSDYAELIRLSIAAARDDGSTPEGDTKLLELKKKLRRRYVSPVPKRTKFNGWHRGLPWLTTTMNAVWAEEVDEFAKSCAARMSKLYSFALTVGFQSSDGLAKGLSHPFMKQVHTLRFSKGLVKTLDDARIVANSPYFSRFSSIVFGEVERGEGEKVFSLLAPGRELELYERGAGNRHYGKIFTTDDLALCQELGVIPRA